MAVYRTSHRGCTIQWVPHFNAYVWEDQHYGAESEDIFATVEAAIADINRTYADGPATPDEIDDLLAQRKLEARP